MPQQYVHEYQGIIISLGASYCCSCAALRDAALQEAPLHVSTM